MTDRSGYFERAGSWSADTQALARRSRRSAWIIAGIAIGIAAFEALALAMLAPLKTVQPVTLLVDRQTGYVQALDPLSPKRVAADDALTNAYLAQYVTAREGFDRATVSVDYRRVALWSTERARHSYLSHMPATNPASPFQRYPAGATVRTTVKSLSRLSPGVALVRFDTQVQARDGRIDPTQLWIAVIRFRFVDAPMQFADRLVNPLGFQVTSYRRDAEAPPPSQVGREVSVSRSAAYSGTPVAVVPHSGGTVLESGRLPSAASAPKSLGEARRLPLSDALPQTSSRSSIAVSREVPTNQLPLGSPLSPAGATDMRSR